MKPANEIVREIISGSIDPLSHLDEIYGNIAKWEKTVNAYTYLRTKEEVKELLHRKPSGRLSGLMIAVKDNISTRDLPTTAASRMLMGYTPPYNATVIERILKEGGIIIGKTNMDEFAMGSTTEHTPYGPVRNPWDPERTVGGSSGGSAAVLAYGGADLALGSDTGGSVRLPSAFTGTVALKPTYGMVSRYGLIPYANSLEQISPMARTIDDLALLFSVIAGDDSKDSTTISFTDSFELVEIKPSATKVAIIKEFVYGMDKALTKIFWSTVSSLESEGFEFDLISLPILSYALPAYYVIAMAEASSNLARYDGVIHGNKVKECSDYVDCISRSRGEYLGLEVKTRILMGTYVLMEGYSKEYYVKATMLRRRIRDSIRMLFKDYHLVFTPVSPILPPRLGEKIDDPVKMYSMDIMTVTANLAGIPALSQPAGLVSGLPFGVQWMGPPFSEPKLLGVAKILEDKVGILTPLR